MTHGFYLFCVCVCVCVCVSWGCVLQVSALQQGAGIRDGVAEEEGTVDLGPKRLWKVGNGELFVRSLQPTGQEWEVPPAWAQLAMALIKLGAFYPLPTPLSPPRSLARESVGFQFCATAHDRPVHTSSCGQASDKLPLVSEPF